MRTMECTSEQSFENEVNYFKRHGGRNKCLMQQGTEGGLLVTDNISNNPGGRMIASTDAFGKVKIYN